jgi:hypothetical protein
MRVLITGGRDFSDRKLLYETLTRLHSQHKFTALIHGDARGADRLGGEWASSMGIPVEAFPADWKKHGKAAGPIRNATMLKARPDMLVAFPGGRGTADMVQKAEAAGLPVTKV